VSGPLCRGRLAMEVDLGLYATVLTNHLGSPDFDYFTVSLNVAA
jgi:hypothetical protein